MSSAAARAEARRKAILNRGTDRLAKLTTSARGEDAPAFVHDDPPLPSLPPVSKRGLENFLGEDSPLSTPPIITSSSPASRSSGFDAFGLGGSPPDPSVWSQEQQQQLLNALLGGGPGLGPPNTSGTLPATGDNTTPDDPLMAIMSSMGQGGFGGLPKGPANTATSEKPKSRIQRLMPLVHVLAVWCLVTFFAVWKEPEAFVSNASAAVLPGGAWRRWAELGKQQVRDGGWSVQAMPFFWAFVSLELALHSFHIFSGLDATQPPMLLAMALPHLPKPLPSIIIYGLKYMRMAGTLLDDLAAVVFALGFIVFLAGYLAGWA
ncbi:hypothetical protein EVG20_g2857 [Dentipellis fragilis]|uniref:Golgi to ER traffic protein 2 n=1 Tax=Dentipellis fragilis TaxID=205917 RepID=A0A4Y9Z8J5_9AGAM|nr:hypothetical protein EVG20_g2857 [Dentipellis fragilis]